MTTKRDAYKYYFEVNGEIVYKGVTTDLKRREAEHRVRWPEGRIKQVGKKTTFAAALRWARQAVRKSA